MGLGLWSREDIGDGGLASTVLFGILRIDSARVQNQRMGLHNRGFRLGKIASNLTWD